jgi:hypothetical protein
MKVNLFIFSQEMEYQAASYDYIIDDIEFFPREATKQKKRPPRIPKVKYLFLNNKDFSSHSTYADGPYIYICSHTKPLLICSCHNIVEILLRLALNTNQSIFINDLFSVSAATLAGINYVDLHCIKEKKP